MIPKYQKLFGNLNASRARYAIFKGLEHLDEDLAGLRGDLDILIREQDEPEIHSIFLKSGFAPVKWPIKHNGMCFYVAYCPASGKMAYVHLHTHIPVGKNKQYRWDVADAFVSDAVFDEKRNVYVARPENELAALLLRLSQKDSIKADDEERLKKLAQIALKENHHAPLLRDVVVLSGRPMDSFLQEIASSKDLGTTLDSLAENVPQSLCPRPLRRFFTEISSRAMRLFFRVSGTLRRRAGFPQMQKCGKGKLVVFVGVDGAGKSTQIEQIMATDYFRRTGIKRVYFGENEYIIPGLQNFFRFVKNREDKSVLKKAGILLNLLDRRLRLIPALFYKAMGYVVIGDRYFYDDLVFHEKMRAKGRGGLKIKLLRLIENRLLCTPDATVYLRLDGQEAYKRKQDYAEAEKIENAGYYDSVLFSRKEVTAFDATMPPDVLHRLIAPLLLPEYRQDVF